MKAKQPSSKKLPAEIPLTPNEAKRKLRELVVIANRNRKPQAAHK